jgi:hypothetical protein
MQGFDVLCPSRDPLALRPTAFGNYVVSYCASSYKIIVIIL